MADNSYTAEQSPKTPLINFDRASGTFDLKGKSIPENSVLYYKPLFEWLDNYIQGPAPHTTLNIQLDYFNTSSSKCIVDLFKKLEQIAKNAKGQVTINWLYDEQDDDMQEAGEDYKSIIKVPFNLVSFIK
jgi:hypothetical protein